MSENTVFISYSHDTPEHSERVLQLANALRAQGVDVELDRYHQRPPLGWPHWCEEQLRPEKSAFALVICTATYRQRVEGKAPADEGRGVFWEGRIIYNYLYSGKGNERFIPVLFAGATEEDIPPPLQGDTRYQPKAFDLNDAGYLALYRELTGQPAVTQPLLGAIVPLPPNALPALNVSNPLPPRQVLTTFVTPVDLHDFDKYAPAELIGREAEIKLLNEAWAKAQNNEIKRPRVLTFVALGGEGKTSLVAKWAADLAHQNWPGCEAVFAWSFYSQGAREEAAASSDVFLKDALTFFGDKAMAGSVQGAFDKGRRLAQLAGERRALLILDGLEPLQYPPTWKPPGQLKDDGMMALLKGLAANNRGLCVVTTRYSIPDLRAYWQTTAPEVNLLRLSKEAGVDLLRSLEVKGTQKEFETLVEDVNGHALTLKLLGAYLRDAHAGDIRKRDLIKLEEADKEQGGHAFRVMDAYVDWLAPRGFVAWLRAFFSKNERESQLGGRRVLALLRLMGLFDRPADAGCLDALWRAPAINGLTEPLVTLSEAQRNLAITRLVDAKLLTVNRDGSGALHTLDAHQLLREYFAKALREHRPEAWRATHRRLYEHLCATTKDKPQPTLEDLQPLYQAVAHGCAAGMQQEAYRVYCDRIVRGNEFYSTQKLGAFGLDLGAVACFFEQPWTRVSPALTQAYQATILSVAAFNLRALGRLTEAVDPMRSGMKRYVREEDWRNAAAAAGNLSELELTLGEVGLAVADAEQSVTYAGRRGDIAQRIINRKTHADALHQAGRREEAEARFREAEVMQAVNQHEYPLLYSLQGFRYCDLLLAAAERAAWRRMVPSSAARGRDDGPETLEALIDCCRAVSERAARTLQWAEQNKASLLDPALDHLTLGRATLYAAVLESRAFDQRDPCGESLERTVDGLRRAGAQEFLVFGLLTRAWLRFFAGAHTGPDCAQKDLNEAFEIAERGPMPLVMADIHLYRARLFGLSKDRPASYPEKWKSPQDDLAEAWELIERHGYWRRKEELEDTGRISE